MPPRMASQPTAKEASGSPPLERAASSKPTDKMPRRFCGDRSVHHKERVLRKPELVLGHPTVIFMGKWSRCPQVLIIHKYTAISGSSLIPMLGSHSRM